MQKQIGEILKLSKHERKSFNHVFIPSDDSEHSAKVIRYSPNALLIILIVLFLLFGSMIGFIIFEVQMNRMYNEKLTAKDTEIADLTAENTGLNSEIESLNNKIRILSDTVNEKTAKEEELTETLELIWVPMEFPLTGSAQIANDSEDNTKLILKCTEGITVVATASGMVEQISEDDTYGNVIIINHGNGYKSYYYNSASAMVKEGDNVSSGTTLYIIGSNNKTLCYQISYNDEMLDPMEVLDING